MEVVDETRLLRLIDGIYAASVDFQLWPVVLEQIADALGARDASLGAMTRQGIPWIFAPRTDPAFMATYNDYHADDSVWHGVVRAGVGAAVTDTMVMSRDALATSRFHNEWSRPLGYRTVLGGLIMSQDGWDTVLIMPGQHDFEAGQVRLLELLSPHLKRAVQINNRLAANEINENLTQRLLQMCDNGALVADADGHVLYANAIAETWFGPAGGLRIDGGVLSCDHPDQALKLRDLIAASARGGLDDSGGQIQIRAPQGEPLRLVVAPIRRRLPMLAPGHPSVILFDDLRATIQLAPDDGCERLARRYGLTQAETAFLREIVRGDGKQAAAIRRGISFTTARTHLSRIFDKTGVRRQAELVRLALSGDQTP